MIQIQVSRPDTKILAYIKKSLLTQFSYRFALILWILSIVTSLLTFYFIDKLFGFRVTSHLEPYGVNYFSYVLIGISFSGLLGTAFSSISGQIREEQTNGTLESLLVTPTSVFTIITAMILWNLIYAFLEFLFYILVGIFLFKIDFSNINILSTAIITILSIISFNALGIISASFVIVFKRGDPVSLIINIAFELLGGVYFPITVLPKFLQYISNIFPIIYAIRSIELAVYKGANLNMLFSDIILLLIFSVILVPLSILSFKFALNRARKQGNLIQY